MIVGGITTGLSPEAYPEADPGFYGSTLVRNSDVHFYGTALIQSIIIAGLLFPWKQYGYWNRTRIFLSLAGITHGLGKLLQLIRIFNVTLHEYPLVYDVIRMLFLASTVLVYFGVVAKKDIETLRADENFRLNKQELVDYCRDLELGEDEL